MAGNENKPKMSLAEKLKKEKLELVGTIAGSTGAVQFGIKSEMVQILKEYAEKHSTQKMKDGTKLAIVDLRVIRAAIKDEVKRMQKTGNPEGYGVYRRLENGKLAVIEKMPDSYGKRMKSLLNQLEGYIESSVPEGDWAVQTKAYTNKAGNPDSRKVVTWVC